LKSKKEQKEFESKKRQNEEEKEEVEEDYEDEVSPRIETEPNEGAK
jgi:hypothetical protein